jgi:hypothetical protein
VGPILPPEPAQAGDSHGVYFGRREAAFGRKATMTPQSQYDLLLHLQKSGVPFIVIGGHAVSFHGQIRATEDVDVI